MLHLHYRSLVRFSEDVSVGRDLFRQVAEDFEKERMYRIELILRSGEAVPLRWGYMVGKGHHERRAQSVRSVLGLEEPAVVRYRDFESRK